MCTDVTPKTKSLQERAGSEPRPTPPARPTNSFTLLACLSIAGCVFANRLAPGLGILLAVVVAGITAHVSINRANELIIVSLLFQNIFVAFFAEAGADIKTLNLSRSINFVVCVTLFGLCTLSYL